MNLSVKLIKALFEHKGYKFFDGGKPYNLNIIGIRKDTKNISTNRFDDQLLVIYRNNSGEWIVKYFPITTEAGATYLANPINPKGTAILMEGQYRSAYRIGTHAIGRSSAHTALRQVKNVNVFRDNNKDQVFDMDSVENGLFGINIHRASYKDKKLVNNYSAGCQVFKRHYDLNSLLKLCRVSIKKGYGKHFTYTLISETTINKFLNE